MKISTYEEALKYLYTYIPDRDALKFGGDNGIKRTKYLLQLLGNPQEKMQVVHIAGTSGKGSTAYMISHLIQSQGIKVGFQVSPHLIDLRERFQINNQPIDPELFIQYLNQIIPKIEEAKQSQWGDITYFELLVAVAFYIFYEEGMQVAVMETGLGGLYDGTNVVTNSSKIAVITNIGFDHEWILGHTLSEIATQKAGIIQKGNKVVTVFQSQEVLDIFEQTVEKQDASFTIVKENVHYKKRGFNKEGELFDFQFDELKMLNIHLRMIGEYQIANCAVALTAMYLVCKKLGMKINHHVLLQVLSNIQFPGRFEIRKIDDKEVIIDGAHNPQKMDSFIQSLVGIYPNQKINFLVAFSKDKNYKEMFDLIMPLAKKVYLTNFSVAGQDLKRQSEDPNILAEYLQERQYAQFEIIDNDHLDLHKLLEENTPLVITGSLYLIASLYSRIK